jgi:hypothetical protein
VDEGPQALGHATRPRRLREAVEQGDRDVPDSGGSVVEGALEQWLVVWADADPEGLEVGSAVARAVGAPRRLDEGAGNSGILGPHLRQDRQPSG